MDIVEFKEPRTHLLIKDFLTEDEQKMLWDEIKENESKFKSGKYQKGGKEGIHDNVKKNMGFDVTEAIPNIFSSHIRSMFHERIIYNAKMKRIFNTAKSPIYELLRFTTTDRTKVSAYKDGDFYDWHHDITDQGLLTILYMMHKKPRKFSGGNLLLRWNGVERSIPFENNTIIIFPRSTEHKVSEIKMESDDFYDRRFTIQCFANFC